MKRRLSILIRRNVALKKRVTRLSRNCQVSLRGARPPMSLRYAFWSFLSATLGILAIGEMTTLVGSPLLIGSFGASAVLLFGANDSPLAQPRNLVGGHLVSAAVAVIVVALFGSTPLSMAIGVGLAIFVMNMTHTTHPPRWGHRLDRGAGGCWPGVHPSAGFGWSPDPFDYGHLYK